MKRSDSPITFSGHPGHGSAKRTAAEAMTLVPETKAGSAGGAQWTNGPAPKKKPVPGSPAPYGSGE